MVNKDYHQKSQLEIYSDTTKVSTKMLDVYRGCAKHLTRPHVNSLSRGLNVGTVICASLNQPIELRWRRMAAKVRCVGRTRGEMVETEHRTAHSHGAAINSTADDRRVTTTVAVWSSSIILLADVINRRPWPADWTSLNSFNGQWV